MSGGGELLGPFDSADWDAVRRVDTSVTSDRELVVATWEGLPQLAWRPLDASATKVFPWPDEPPRGIAYTARVTGDVIGFVAAHVEPWNMSLVVDHLYVAPAHRRQGLGRRLLEAVYADSRASSAVTVRVETSSRNAPGIAAWQALGFSITGFDTSLYRGTSAAGELAIFLARCLRPADPATPMEPRA